ncbi:two-component system, LytT family, sensor histidine kinase LytS [Paenibacillus sp. yr247]|uniref:LytS/YhcK type 5TM receptor domain-containing protein n=1 Tax=Paenibacillus sp. yr247 TaxID=1761880 RepID=UPI00088685E4|nr:LytS/YhcK type 5TM receptor domain-containing protein [Paenibacillus sp. yr247]SDN70598.1 two-component system, LytT family, sensor histidine kinase LytS [Paenibacillus sp. yr247]
MEALTLLLFERMGILLIVTFILTRIPLVRQLLDRKMSIMNTIYFICLFGLFGILGTYAGVVIEGGVISSSFWILPLQANQALAHSALVGVVIGGLMGGPIVGIGAGLITGVHLYIMSGFTGLAGGIAAPLTGFLAGGVARFFLQERVISSAKAIFIGMFAPIMQMGIILIVSKPSENAIELVDMIGIPMVLTNSISIAIFTTMLRVVFREEERAAAYETQRALHIAEAALPHLKQGLTYQSAEAIARLLLRELKTAAVAVTDSEKILAHVGFGAMILIPGEPIRSELSRQAIATGKMQIAFNHEEIQPNHKVLGAAIIVPIKQAGRVAGLIKLYFKKPQEIRSVEIVLAQGLGKLLSYQLSVAMHESMEALMKESELRILQSQINPHFLFNTLNSIVSLIRIEPDMARHITMQLSTFMRLNIKIIASQQISIQQEMIHLSSYLEIIQIRFKDQITMEVQLDSDLPMFMIPPVTLQPLVENCIKHGLKDRTHGGQIRIEVKNNNHSLEISVEDNGSGMAPELIEKLGKEPVNSLEGNGIGVFNVNQRLIGLFGEQSGLFIENKSDGGCRFTFSIPRISIERGISR